MTNKTALARLALLITIPTIFIVILIPQSRVESAERPNVIFIVVDTLRADHVSSYGYTRPTTPQLDSWLAQEGTQFTNASSTSAWTYPANAGILTGKQPANLGVTWSQWKHPENRIPESEKLLAEYLHDEGYATAGFTSVHFVSSQFGFGQGFDTYQNSAGSLENKTWADDINTEAMNWLSTEWDETQPMFLFLYYFDSHSWYNPPAPYDTLYDPTYTGTLTAEVYQTGRPVAEGDVIATDRDIEHVVALYDGCITYWDTQFGQMMTFLEQNGVLDDSLIILTSDHGEMFGEHDEWAHHNSVYEEVLRVPFVVRYDGVVNSNVSLDAPVSTLDITPTILDFLDISPSGQMDGVSLAEGLRGNVTLPADRLIYSEADAVTDPNDGSYWHAPHHELRAVQQSGWKYIYGFADTTLELYQLQPDSLYEVDNIYDSEPSQVSVLHNQLDSWFFLPTEYSFLPSVTK